MVNPDFGIGLSFENPGSALAGLHAYKGRIHRCLRSSSCTKDFGSLLVVLYDSLWERSVSSQFRLPLLHAGSLLTTLPA